MKTTEKASIALIFGGRGCEHDISVRGAEYVFPLIDSSKYRKIPIYIRKNGSWAIPVLRDIPTCPTAVTDEAVPTEECFPLLSGNTGGLYTKNSFIPIVSAFPLLHGDFGEDGSLQGALETAKVPYVGCGVSASAAARDKCYVKLIAKELGIPTAKWIYLTSPLTEDIIAQAEEKLKYPMFVKPARLGSSLGAGIAKDRAELRKAVKTASDLGFGRVLIEEFIEIKKELECGYFGTKSKQLFTEVGEISYRSGFYDYETKYMDSGAEISEVAKITKQESDLVRLYSSCLAEFLGLSGLSRIDYLQSVSGKIYFNEINTMPGFTEASLYPRLAKSIGLSPAELVNGLIFDKIKA